MTPAAPKRLDVDREQLRKLELQTRQRNLSDTEFETLQATTETLLWVADQLKLRNQRLYRMLFGPSSEKTSAVLVEQAEGGRAESSAESDNATVSRHAWGAAVATWHALPRARPPSRSCPRPSA